MFWFKQQAGWEPKQPPGDIDAGHYLDVEIVRLLMAEARRQNGTAEAEASKGE